MTAKAIRKSSSWGDKTKPLNNFDRAIAGDLAAKGVSYPQDLVAVSFFLSEKWGQLSARYFFNPELDGITSNTVLNFAESDWNAPNIVRYREKLAYIDKLKAWGQQNWRQFSETFDHGENAPVPQLPANPAAAATTNVQNVQRGARSGGNQKIWHTYSINPDCSSEGEITGKITSLPAHGKITFVQEDGYTTFSKENVRNTCNAQLTPGLSLYYTSEVGYIGPDAFSVSFVYPGGNIQQVNYTVTVQ